MHFQYAKLASAYAPAVHNLACALLCNVYFEACCLLLGLLMPGMTRQVILREWAQCIQGLINKGMLEALEL